MKENDISKILAEVICEYERAISLHPKFNSRHEGYAILKEEIDELWEEIKKNHVNDTSAKYVMRKEAIQCAAMSLRFIKDCCDNTNHVTW